MKKIIFILLGAVLSFTSSIKQTNPIDFEKKFDTSDYQVNSPNWSTEELEKYCLENGIAPSTPPKGTEEMLYSYNISSHLKSRYSGDYLWEMVPSESNSV